MARTTLKIHQDRQLSRLGDILGQHHLPGEDRYPLALSPTVAAKLIQRYLEMVIGTLRGTRDLIGRANPMLRCSLT